MTAVVGLDDTSGGGSAGAPRVVPIANSRPATPNKPASAGKKALTGASSPPATSGDPNTATPSRPLARNAMNDQPTCESLKISTNDTPARTKNIQGAIASSTAPTRLPNSSSAAITTRPMPRPRTLPATESRSARFPCPCLTSRCPGNSANDSSPGTPRNSPGTTSKKVWEIASAQVNASSAEYSMPKAAQLALLANSRAVTVLTWMPGTRPVTMPVSAPKTEATITMCRRETPAAR